MSFGGFPVKKPGLSHDEFARSIRGPPSPLKASKRAAQHILQRKRVPLHSLLESLERTVCRLTSSPARVTVFAGKLSAG